MVGYFYSYGLSLVGHSIVTRVLRLQQVVMENGAKAWPFSSSQYVQEAWGTFFTEVYLPQKTDLAPPL
jgi:hypothetical protein